MNNNHKPNEPPIFGGVSLQRVPVIPWKIFVGIGIQFYKDGKVQLGIFDPQPMIDAEDAFQTLRLLMCVQQQTIKALMYITKMAPLERQPGPLQWDTVPESVKKHFRFEGDEPTIETG